MMNNKAKELGCLNTNFINPNGVHDNNHYSTAYDLALIGQYAMKFDDILRIAKVTQYTLPKTNKYDEEKLFLYSELKIDNQKFIDTQIDRINACIQDNNIEISLEEKNKVKMKKIGEFFRWSCIFWVLISLFFFAIGVYEIKNGFENSLVLPVKSDTTIIKRDNSINVEGTNSIEFKK